MTYVISNGKKFSCSYCHTSRKFKGLGFLSDSLGLTAMPALHMLLFTYEVDSVVSITAFDEQLCEIVFPGHPLSSGK